MVVGIDVVYPNMDRKTIDSLKIESYADAPHMLAEGITDYLIENGVKYDFSNHEFC